MKKQIESLFLESLRCFSLKAFATIFIFACTACVVSAQMETIGNVLGPIERSQNGVTFSTSSGAIVSAQLFTDEVVRIRVNPTGKFERDQSYAFELPPKPQRLLFAVSETPEKIILSAANGVRVEILRKPFSINILDNNGQPILRDDTTRPIMFDKISGEIHTTKLRRSEVETYYGFGEKAFIEMSRNGKYIVNWNTDTFAYPIGTDPIYQSIPFFYGLHNGKAYGLFFNNTFRTYFDMGKTSPERYTFGAAGGELDYFVFSGGKDRSPKKVLADYASLTGKTPLPPIWALGNQQSRWSYFPEKRVKEIAEGFRKNNIPADVLYLDIDYMDDYRVFTWNKERFPDPKRMIGELRKDGFRTVLIIDPGIKVDENYSVYSEGKRQGMFVKNPDGTELQRDVWPKASAFPDYTDPKARQWFATFYKAHLEEGVAGFWNDMNEPGVFVKLESERPEIFHHPEKTFPIDTPHAGDGMPDTHKRYHNVYGMLMARSSFEGLRKLEPEKRPFVLTRAGFAGVQRYSAVWTGDNYSAWEHLALSIPMLANMSVSGVPFVGADVGGFQDMPTGELYARWLQAAALTPFLRSHSVGWVGNKEPWEFGEEFTKINRASVELRYKFLPYLYTLFREHERSGAPVMRPLWYEFPEDKATYLINDQYMVGDDVLVAPVVKDGMRTRGIYLPLGAEWIDWWTGEKYESGKTHYLPTPLDRLPLFVRVGAVIPTQSAIQHTGEMPDAEITLNIAAGIKPGVTEVDSLFEDSGDGYGYRGNDWSELKVTHKMGSITLAGTGQFQGQKVTKVVVHGIGSRPSGIRADGSQIEFQFDATLKRLEFPINGNEKELTLVR